MSLLLMSLNRRQRKDESNQPNPPLQKYEMEVHNTVMDCAIQSIANRFEIHKHLYTDLQYFEPDEFSRIYNTGLSDHSLEIVWKLIRKVEPGISVSDLQTELMDFAWKMAIPVEFTL